MPFCPMDLAQLRTSTFYTLLLLLLSAVAGALSHSKVVEVFHLERLFSQDLELNDLYYQLESWQDEPKIHQVVLVNTASLAPPQDLARFRDRLHVLMRNLDELEPTVMGVDLFFRELQASDSPALLRSTERLKGVLEKLPNVIVGVKKGADANHLALNQAGGVVNFPDVGRVSIRRYRREFEQEGVGALSFGAALAEHHRPGCLEAQEVPDEFPLRYGKFENLVTRIEAGGGRKVMGRRTQGVPVIDAAAFLVAPDSFAAWIRGSAVILGEVSESPFLIEDKHRVPCDTVLVSRIPTVSGPVIHAIAAETMLNFSSRGWRFVPDWLQTLMALVMLFALVHLLLHTRFGKKANFVILSMATIPLIFAGIWLMDLGYYWPMTSTLLPFIFIEEIMEVVIPITNRVKAFVVKRFKWWGALAGLLMLPMLSQGQSIEVLMIEGKAECNGLDYSPGHFDSFVVYPGDEVILSEGAQALALDTDSKKSAILDQAGTWDWGAMQRHLQGDAPSLGMELLRLFVVEGIVEEGGEENVGAATRGGGAWKVFPPDGATVVSDSIWVGFDPDEVLPSPLEFFIRTPDGALVGSGLEPGANGFWWTPPNRNVRVNAEALFYGNPISNWQFRVEEGAAVGRERRLKLALLEQCTECGPAMRDSLLKAWGELPD